MFIRVKGVVKDNGKDYEYGYLVSSKLRKRSKRKGGKRYSEHKYKEHVGRVYRYKPSYFCNFLEFIGGNFEYFVENSRINEIYKKFIEYELISCGFKKNRMLYFNDNVIVDLKRLMVHCDGKEAIVKVSKERGYICSHYLEELFKIDSINGRKEGMELMKRLKQVGAKIDSENFYYLIKKLLVK